MGLALPHQLWTGTAFVNSPAAQAFEPISSTMDGLGRPASIPRSSTSGGAPGTSLGPHRYHRYGPADGAAPGEHDRGPELGDLGDRLRQVLVDASRERPIVLVVDLLCVTFIDSTGIGPLAAGYNAARRFGVRFTIRRPSPFIVTQLRQTGLYDVLTADR